MPLISGLDLVKGMISGGEEAVTAFFHLSGGEWFVSVQRYHMASRLTVCYFLRASSTRCNSP